ncbi:MAG TPA: dephospho-CoA kinase, partial [Polyangiaceae bacterium]|nr:dephospho-CoA kinase [Polyangiaceae bacterium]
VVSCSPEIQLARVRARDASSQEDALARIRAQKPLAEKVALADYVIDTEGSLDDNARRTDEVLDAICSAAGVDPLRFPRPVKD